MNYKLPILSVVVVALVVAASVRGQLPQTLTGKKVDSNSSTPATPPSRPTAPPMVDGNDLVAQAARKLLSTPGIEAKARQSVDIFGQRLVGSGHYLQLPHPSSPMLRLDLKMQVGDGVITLQQIADGNTFWIRRDQPDGGGSLSRVSLRRLRKVVNEKNLPAPPSLWLALGGLPRLMDSLVHSFDFGPAEPIAIRQLPLWKVEGTWKPEVLAQLLAAQDDTAPQSVDLEQLPAQLPHGVTLILGRDDVTPLFPYGVFYFRQKQAEAGQGRVTRRGLVSLELFEVRLRPDLTPRHFEYVPGDQEVEERTDEYIARLRQ
jgi:hypothetical protein